MQNAFLIYIILSAIAVCVASLVFPLALRFAKKHKILDVPDGRKLQKAPVPVFGGIVVVSGILVSLACASIFFHINSLWYTVCSIILLWSLGTLDDIRGLSAWIRFIAEFALVWILIWHPNEPDNGLLINNLHGLFNRHEISPITAIPLTLIAGVGIINSINLIDGVDGYSSGYGIVANMIFAGIFWYTGDVPMTIFALTTAFALIPFYMHNVFGQSSKMYLGDGGSLVIGFILSCHVFSILDSRSGCTILEEHGIGLAAMTLAILCIPVFDTLRVMSARLINGTSPFQPDKTHLHHLLIDMGCSHAGTSTTIIIVQILIVGIWFGCAILGLGITMQMILVISLGLIVCGTYYWLRECQKRDNGVWKKCCQFGKRTHFEKQFSWMSMQKIVDFLG